MAWYRCVFNGTTAVDITPSNSSPVSLTANTPVNPTTAGYAIESYTRESLVLGEGVRITNNQIVQADGNNLYAAYPISLTPSDSSPQAIDYPRFYRADASGYAIQSYSDVTPSNSSPVDLASGSIYKMGGAGKAVASVIDVNPNDTDPPELNLGSIYKPTLYGYLFQTNKNAGITNVDGKSVFGFAIVTTTSSSGSYTAIPKFYKGMTVNSNNYFVIQKAGTYQIYCAGNGSANNVRLSINGGTATTGWKIDTTKTLSVGDTVRCYCNGGSSGGSAAIYIYKT